MRVFRKVKQQTTTAQLRGSFTGSRLLSLISLHLSRVYSSLDVIGSEERIDLFIKKLSVELRTVGLTPRLTLK